MGLKHLLPGIPKNKTTWAGGVRPPPPAHTPQKGHKLPHEPFRSGNRLELGVHCAPDTALLSLKGKHILIR